MGPISSARASGLFIYGVREYMELYMQGGSSGNSESDISCAGAPGALYAARELRDLHKLHKERGSSMDM